MQEAGETPMVARVREAGSGGHAHTQFSGGGALPHAPHSSLLPEVPTPIWLQLMDRKSLKVK